MGNLAWPCSWTEAGLDDTLGSLQPKLSYGPVPSRAMRLVWQCVKRDHGFHQATAETAAISDAVSGLCAPICCTATCQLGLRGQAHHGRILTQPINPAAAERALQAAIHCRLQRRHLPSAQLHLGGQTQGSPPGEQSPRWHSSTRWTVPEVAQQHPEEGNLPGDLSFPHLLPSREPSWHPCKPSFLSSRVAEVWITTGSQSARATSICQKYNLFYCPNEGNENITSIKTQISVNKALASSHSCQTFGISLPTNERSLRSRNSRQPHRDFSGRLSCGAGRTSRLLHRHPSPPQLLHLCQETACHQKFRIILIHPRDFQQVI